MSFLLVGNYGDRNIGDEALRSFFLTEFSSIDWRIVSSRPTLITEVPRLPCGLRSFFSPWWKTICALSQSKGVVYGGGSLFTDTESLWACFIWASYAIVGRIFCKPILLTYQGVGPFRTAIGEMIARWVFRHAAFISVRDESSLERVRAWKTRVTAILTFDPAFLFFSSRVRIPSHQKTLLLIPRSNSNEAFFASSRSLLSSEHWDVVRILLLQPSVPERIIARRLQEMCQKAVIIEPQTIDEFLTEVSRASSVLSQRYHGALAALAMHVPVEVVPLTDGDKLDALKRFACDLSAVDRTRHLLKSHNDHVRAFLLS